MDNFLLNKIKWPNVKENSFLFLRSLKPVQLLSRVGWWITLLSCYHNILLSIGVHKSSTNFIHFPTLTCNICWLRSLITHHWIFNLFFFLRHFTYNSWTKFWCQFHIIRRFEWRIICEKIFFGLIFSRPYISLNTLFIVRWIWSSEVGFVSRLFVSCNKIIDSHMNNIAINWANKIVILFHGKGIGSNQLLLNSIILLFDRIWLAFKNGFKSFSFIGFFISGLFKPCHCCWQLYRCINILFTSNNSNFSPLYSFLLCLWWLFLWDLHNFSIKVSIF